MSRNELKIIPKNGSASIANSRIATPSTAFLVFRINDLSTIPESNKESDEKKSILHTPPISLPTSTLLKLYPERSAASIPHPTSTPNFQFMVSAYTTSRRMLFCNDDWLIT